MILSSVLHGSGVSTPQSLFRPMSRWRAASIHLGICVTVALLLCALLFFVWYPSPLFQAQGGQDLLILLFGVDVVIGPVITLVIFDTKKRSLRFDLAVVALLQLTALAYGVSVAFQARPAFITFYNDWFEVIPANGLDEATLAQAKFGEFQSLSLTGPRLAAAQMPDNPGERNTALFRALAGFDVTYFPKYYVPYAQAKKQTLAKAKSIAELRRLNPKEQAAIDRFVASHGGTDDAVRYLPVKARRDFVTAMLDASTGDFLGLLSLVPW